ncbi:MAG: LamB/YcsF family protein [Syntrophobacteraceae bacterium]
MKRIDLNCDMGESYGVYTLGRDSEVIRFITSANIACGFHAGDPQVMSRTVRLAAAHGVAVGAHPGFPDRLGFGRRKLECSVDEIRDYMIYQVGALNAFCNVHGVQLRHVKPHGSLYNMAAADENLLRAIAQAVVGVNPELLLVTLAGGNNERLAQVGREEGVTVVFEAFPDRAYTAEGALASRKLPGALIHDPKEASERAVRIVKEGRVIATDGSSIRMDAQTLCIHGDTPTALELASTIRETLEREGITVQVMEQPYRNPSRGV